MNKDYKVKIEKHLEKKHYFIKDSFSPGKKLNKPLNFQSKSLR